MNTSYTLRTYVTGFVLSLVLTCTGYFFAVDHAVPLQIMLVVIVVCAVVQFVVQMSCFLHLGKDESSREKLVVLACAAVIVSILVGGSLWIMSSLNSRMMPTQDQMVQYMQSQTGI